MAFVSVGRVAVSLLIGLGLAGCAATQPLRQAKAAVTPPESAVVLLINTRLDGSQVYGAGLVLNDRGHVATSLRLVADSFGLMAMTYDPRRMEALPQGPDLARFIYENGSVLVPAQLLRGDVETDLALVRVDGGLTAMGRLPFAASQDDAVAAIGHLDERVWSTVSLRADFAGEQWGVGSPLLNSRGEVVALGVLGWDLSPVARPIALVRAFLAETLVPPSIDLSTPERGFASCTHALRVGSSDYLGCLDWESRGRVIRAAFLQEAERRQLPQDELKLLTSKLAALEPQLLAAQREVALVQVRGGEGELALRLRETPRSVRPYFKRVEEMDPLELRYRMDLAAQGSSQAQVRVSDTGMPIKDWARLGLKVEEFLQPKEDLAVLRVSSVDLTGEVFRFSQVLLRRNGKWLQCEFPSQEELAKVPADWPRPLSDLDGVLSYLFGLDDAKASR